MLSSQAWRLSREHSSNRMKLDATRSNNLRQQSGRQREGPLENNRLRQFILCETITVVHSIRGHLRASARIRAPDRSNSIRDDWLGTDLNRRGFPRISRMAADYSQSIPRVLARFREFFLIDCSKPVSPSQLGTHWDAKARELAKTRESKQQKRNGFPRADPFTSVNSAAKQVDASQPS